MIDADHFQQTCASLGQIINATMLREFPEEQIGYVLVLKTFGPSRFTLSLSNIRADKVEEIFTETLAKTREAKPKPLASIIQNLPNPFDSLRKNPRD